MSVKAKGKIFRDPVHGLIRILEQDAFLYELINTPEFQRLRHIRQLGMSSLTYPGAEQSRFGHSLGVYWLANRMLQIIEQGGCPRPDMNAFRRAVLAAALLHDLGHGPFSHVMERALPDDFLSHEDQTCHLICDPASNVNRVLTEHDVVPKTVASIINKTMSVHWMVDIVSSQLDADRMDYLLRDSLSTGVKYGLYDCEWLLNCICLGEPSQEVDEDEKKPVKRLCLDKSRGLHSVEQLIMARMHMSKQVYYHEVTRGFEAHFICIFDTALQLLDQLPSETPETVRMFLKSKGRLDYQAWLGFDETAVEQALWVWSRCSLEPLRGLASLCSAFRCREKIFRCRELDVSPDVSAKNAQKKRWEQAALNAGLVARRDYLFDEVKTDFYKRSESIYLLDRKTGATIKAENESRTLDSLLETSRNMSCRVFYHKDKARIAESVFTPLSGG